MTLVEQIEEQLLRLPEAQQHAVLEYVTALRSHGEPLDASVRETSLGTHPAFGSWAKRNVDALVFEQQLRSEWPPEP